MKIIIYYLYRYYFYYYVGKWNNYYWYYNSYINISVEHLLCVDKSSLITFLIAS